MAEVEASFTGKNLNSYLRHITRRSIDSVKNRRKRQDYKNMVALLKDHLEQNLPSLESTLATE